jgi:N-acetylmuramoyl-L-alanine amidase
VIELFPARRRFRPLGRQARALAAAPPPAPDAPLVVLDPGHGGRDPGAIGAAARRKSGSPWPPRSS